MALCVNRFRRAGENATALDMRSRMVREVAGNAAGAAWVRWEFAHWLQRHFCLGEQRRSDLVLAVNEATANAVEYGCPNRAGQGTVVVDATYDSGTGSLTVTVSDRGRWRLVAVETPTETKQLVDRGRGIALMRLLTDELRISPSAGGTQISLVWTDLQSRNPVLSCL